MSLESPERFASIVADMKKDGDFSLEGVSYEEMKRGLNREQYEIKVSNNFVIGMMIEPILPISYCLGKKNWTMIVAPEPLNFLCSDFPVILTSSTPRTGLHGIGFAQKDSVVVVPVSKSLLLYGSSENNPKQYLASAEMVARYNTLILNHVERFAYSPHVETTCYPHTPSRIIDRMAELKASSKAPISNPGSIL